VHAIDTTLDLYGQKVEVRFLRRLRGDQRFPSADALIAQMRADQEAALAVWGTASSSGEPRE
jgi:riboflavin kinase/FMN adenylyltransferase